MLALPETVARRDARITEAGLVRCELLDVQAPSRRTALGRNVPNVADLTGLTEFFGIEEGILCFTDPAPTALNRELHPVLQGAEGSDEEAAER
ncbi:hypothetical protein [Streptomyces sp. NPDC002845]